MIRNFEQYENDKLNEGKGWLIALPFLINMGLATSAQNVDIKDPIVKQVIQQVDTNLTTVNDSIHSLDSVNQDISKIEKYYNILKQYIINPQGDIKSHFDKYIKENNIDDLTYSEFSSFFNKKQNNIIDIKSLQNILSIDCKLTKNISLFLNITKKSIPYPHKYVENPSLPIKTDEVDTKTGLKIKL